VSSNTITNSLKVPFFRPALTEAEIQEVVECLRSGWLTTGPRTREFETRFAEQTGASHAIAVNSCTAALHLAVEALKLRAGQAVLVPTMTFAATAEVVRYQGAIPVLVDCDPVTLNMDLQDAEQKLAELKAGKLFQESLQPVGIMPVHVGGMMMNIQSIREFASRHGLWIVEDAAHAFPAAWRPTTQAAWQRCGEETATVTCYSFYTNKTITTGEGGMAVTNDADLAARMRQMSLHGLSLDAWGRYTGKGNWDYRIVAPGYKYNLTDIAASLGIHQLTRAESMRLERQSIAAEYSEQLRDVPQLELPTSCENRIHSWHLYPVRLNLGRLTIDRNTFLDQLKQQGVGCSVHWRPLHLHPYYEENFGWRPEQLPVATREWERCISLPLFPGMSADEKTHVVQVVKQLCEIHAAAQ
jgi:dTDP-4-amino-4,6-dideoxygalactose transaminase